MTKTKIELLSPAKNKEFGIAAINSGADAVYIGAPAFGARSAAGNSVSDIASLIKYAHLFNTQVYVTINTVLYDSELEEVTKLINSLYSAGADALIIQDMSILEMDIPPIQLFASTQTHNYSIDRIKFLEQTGIQRIILARELSLPQIAELKQNTNADLEFFIHGALCVSFSGQCYFSQAVAGRSANRGDCGQHCRMLYSLEDSLGKTLVKNKYLLSMKDLNLSSYLKNLIDSGITSFKIEGRLKDIGYVKNVTAYYRQKLDEIIDGNPLHLEKSSSGKITYFFVPDPEKSFNRSFTNYFIENKAENIASLNTQKAMGKRIGIAKNVFSKFFEVDSIEKISNGDGLCFFDKKELLNGFNVNKVDGKKIYADDLSELYSGAQLFRNNDHQFEKEMLKDVTVRTIDVSLSLKAHEETLILSATDEDGNCVEVQRNLPNQLAEHPEKMMETIQRQLRKTGSSIFRVTEINTEMSKQYFLTVSFLNELRREAITCLEQKRISTYTRAIKSLPKSELLFPEKKLTYHNNVTNEMAREFYSKHGVEEIADGYEVSTPRKGDVIMTTRYCIKRQIEICPFENEFKNDFKEPYFLNDGSRKYELEFDCANCQMRIKL